MWRVPAASEDGGGMRGGATLRQPTPAAAYYAIAIVADTH